VVDKKTSCAFPIPEVARFYQDIPRNIERLFKQLVIRHAGKTQWQSIGSVVQSVSAY
jgi:hypothetical protein